MLTDLEAPCFPARDKWLKPKWAGQASFLVITGWWGKWSVVLFVLYSCSPIDLQDPSWWMTPATLLTAPLVFQNSHGSWSTLDFGALHFKQWYYTQCTTNGRSYVHYNVWGGSVQHCTHYWVMFTTQFWVVCPKLYGVVCITHYGVVCTTLWSGMHHTVGWYAPQCAPHCTGASLQPHGAVLDHLQWSGQGTCSQHCSSCQLTEWGKVSTIGFLFSLIRHILQHFFGVKQNIFMPSATEFLFCCWFVFFFVKTIYIPYYTKVMFFDDFNFFILQIII